MSEYTQAEANHAPRRGTSLPPQHQPPKRILVVDDDAAVREALGELLIQEHYIVKLASDGREAVLQFLDGPPDLILLDVNMPDITGWQVSEILAQFKPAAPVMVITAHGGQARRAADLGVNAFMEKPLDIPVLLRTVHELLAHPDSTHFPRGRNPRPTNDVLGSQG